MPRRCDDAATIRAIVHPCASGGIACGGSALRNLDVADVETRVRALLAEPARERLERGARLALTPHAALTTADRHNLSRHQRNVGLPVPRSTGSDLS
jgi:hypothetical protein